MTSYKKRLINVKETVNYHKMQMDLNEITCPVCMDLIINSTITICGHTFCEKCLSEALILSQVFDFIMNLFSLFRNSCVFYDIF